ncbi:MAG: hypothetical protein RIQ93_2900, partial [Verrucomicrobiota bacterium]
MNTLRVCIDVLLSRLNLKRGRARRSHEAARSAAGLALLVTLAVSGCRRSDGAPKVGPAPAVPVQTAVAQQLDVPRVIESVGSIQAVRTVAVKSQVDGMIAEIHFKEGDEVKAGDLLVSLDRRPFENSLRITRADLANVRAESAKATGD